MKNDSFVVHDDQATRDESRMNEFFLRDLAFAFESSQAGPPGGRAGGHVIVACNFHCFDLIALLFDPNYLIEMPGVMTNPLTC